MTVKHALLRSRIAGVVSMSFFSKGCNRSALAVLLFLSIHMLANFQSFCYLKDEAFAKTQTSAFGRKDDGFASYLGMGYSGSTFGRQVPGLHLALGYSFLQLSFFTVGTTSQNGATSHQNYMIGYQGTAFHSSSFHLSSTLGIAMQSNWRQLNDGSIKQTESDQSYGPGFASSFCFLPQSIFQAIPGQLCLRLEAILGIRREAIEQIYQENALASVGYAF